MTLRNDQLKGAGGAAGFVITDVTNPGMKSLVGRRLSEIAQEQKKDPVDVIMDLIGVPDEEEFATIRVPRPAAGDNPVDSHTLAGESR